MADKNDMVDGIDLNEAAGRIARAIEYGFVSPNVADSNLEPANIVDVLQLIAIALEHVAAAIAEHGEGQ